MQESWLQLDCPAPVCRLGGLLKHCHPWAWGCWSQLGNPSSHHVLSWDTTFLVARVHPAWDGCLDRGLQPAPAPGQSSTGCRDERGQLPPTLLTHAGASMGVHVSWHHWGHVFKLMAARTQAQGLALCGLSWMLYLGAARQSRERSRTGSHPALCAKGALTLWGWRCRSPLQPSSHGQRSDMLQPCRDPALSEAARGWGTQAGHRLCAQAGPRGGTLLHPGHAAGTVPAAWQAGGWRGRWIACDRLGIIHCS